MDYRQQLKLVTEFIGENLDEKISLIQLSDIACFSKYHFHRLFTAYMGLSLHQYIRWLRLKRAAHQLIVNKDQSIIEIAIHAGFESTCVQARIKLEFMEDFTVSGMQTRGLNDGC